MSIDEINSMNVFRRVGDFRNLIVGKILGFLGTSFINDQNNGKWSDMENSVWYANTGEIIANSVEETNTRSIVKERNCSCLLWNKKLFFVQGGKNGYCLFYVRAVFLKNKLW
eukprot:TRINITY_DN6877_c0_g2_i4.p1 TRINITY_DN6877_c0_g2~~TRINITY_DN6877_c0_g2_i4.p1  ORF type:complete len:112 (+),score=8.13 TRINITY_DN6877_c0_g2_i4:620-955(+)